MTETSNLDWESSLTHSYDEISSQLVAFAPLLAGAVALLFAGWIVAHICRIISAKFVGSLDSLLRNSVSLDDSQPRKPKRHYSLIISKLVFWIVILFFVALSTHLLGWNLISNSITGIGVYLPNLIAGLIAILAGFVLAKIVRKAVVSTALSTGIEHAALLGRIVQLTIIFTALIIGIEQIGINVDFVTNILVVSVGMLFAGGALAFGLGAKTLIANIIGAQYLRKHCRIAEVMQIGDIEGSIVEVTQTSIVLDTDLGRTVIPAKYFQEQITSFKSAGDLLDKVETVAKPVGKQHG